MNTKIKILNALNFYKYIKWMTLIFVVIFTYILLFLFPESWHFVIGPVHLPDVHPFLDMKGRLAHIQGHMMGLDVYNRPNPLDPLKRINDKPSYTLMLGYLGLNLQHAVPLSIFFIILMVFGTLFLIKPRTWWQMIAAYLALCSPSVLLAAERGNDDIIIFGFLLCVPIFLSKNSLSANAVAFCLISLVSPAKYYPFAAYILFAHLQKNNRQIFFWLTASISAISVFLLFTYREILFLHSRIPKPSGLTTFGAKLLFELLGFKSPIPQLLSLVALSTLLMFVAMPLLHRRAILPKIEKREENYFLLGVAILVFCFFLNSNNDYRLIFCLFLFPALFSWLRNSQISSYLRRVIIWSIILIITIMWIPYAYFFFNQVELDFSFLNKYIYIFRIILTWLLIVIITALASLILRPSILQILGRTQVKQAVR